MSFAGDLCEYLAENHLLWDSMVVEDGFTLDVDVLELPDSGTNDVLYLNQVPQNKTGAVCIYDTGGYEAFRTYGGCRRIEQPTAQIRIRNSSLRVCEETAYRIYTFLDDSVNISISGRLYLQINAVSSPVYLGVDMVTSAGISHEYSFNLYAKVQGFHVDLG